MDEPTVQGVNDVTTFVAAHFEAERAKAGALHQALNAHLEVGMRLEARAGQEQLARTRTAVEEQFAVALSGLDAVTGLLAARSISPRIWASLENGDLVQPAVRSILELAIKKYGTWANVDRDLEELPAFTALRICGWGKALTWGFGRGTGAQPGSGLRSQPSLESPCGDRRYAHVRASCRVARRERDRRRRC